MCPKIMILFFEDLSTRKRTQSTIEGTPLPGTARVGLCTKLYTLPVREQGKRSQELRTPTAAAVPSRYCKDLLLRTIAITRRQVDYFRRFASTTGRKDGGRTRFSMIWPMLRCTRSRWARSGGDSLAISALLLCYLLFVICKR